jgi:hypothetical protein
VNEYKRRQVMMVVDSLYELVEYDKKKN